MNQMFNGLELQLGKILPLSPFTQFIAQMEAIPFLPYLNWFVPVRGILTIFSAWLGVVAVFYSYSILLRWVKVLSD